MMILCNTNRRRSYTIETNEKGVSKANNGLQYAFNIFNVFCP